MDVHAYTCRKGSLESGTIYYEVVNDDREYYIWDDSDDFVNFDEERSIVYLNRTL